MRRVPTRTNDNAACWMWWVANQKEKEMETQRWILNKEGKTTSSRTKKSGGHQRPLFLLFFFFVKHSPQTITNFFPVGHVCLLWTHVWSQEVLQDVLSDFWMFMSEICGVLYLLCFCTPHTVGPTITFIFFLIIIIMCRVCSVLEIVHSLQLW